MDGNQHQGRHPDREIPQMIVKLKLSPLKLSQLEGRNESLNNSPPPLLSTTRFAAFSNDPKSSRVYAFSSANSSSLLTPTTMPSEIDVKPSFPVLSSMWDSSSTDISLATSAQKPSPTPPSDSIILDDARPTNYAKLFRQKPSQANSSAIDHHATTSSNSSRQKAGPASVAFNVSGSSVPAKRTLDNEELNPRESPIVPAKKKTKKDRKYCIGWLANEKSISVYAQWTLGAEAPVAVAMDEDEVPLTMLKLWDDLFAISTTVKFADVALDPKIFPSQSEKLGALTVDDKINLIKERFFPGRSVIDLSETASSQTTSATTKIEEDLRTERPPQETPSYRKRGQSLHVGYYRDNPKKWIYARLGKMQNSGWRVVLSTESDGRLVSTIDFEKPYNFSRIVFMDEFKTSDCEKTKLAIKSRLEMSGVRVRKNKRNNTNVTSPIVSATPPPEAPVPAVPEILRKENAVGEPIRRDTRAWDGKVLHNVRESLEKVAEFVRVASEKYEDDFARRNAEVERKLNNVSEKEDSIRLRETALNTHLVEINERESSFTEKELSLIDRERAMKAREDSVKEREDAVQVREARAGDQELRDKELELKTAELPKLQDKLRKCQEIANKLSYLSRFTTEDGSGS